MLSRMDTVIWLWYVSIISTVGPYNILFIPNMYPSIHLYISNIAEAAVKAGHKAYFALPTSIPSSYIERGQNNGNRSNLLQVRRGIHFRD